VRDGGDVQKEKAERVLCLFFLYGSADGFADESAPAERAVAESKRLCTPHSVAR
jgi:hypothetical protein